MNCIDFREQECWNGDDIIVGHNWGYVPVTTIVLFVRDKSDEIIFKKGVAEKGHQLSPNVKIDMRRRLYELYKLAQIETSEYNSMSMGEKIRWCRDSFFESVVPPPLIDKYLHIVFA